MARRHRRPGKGIAQRHPVAPTANRAQHVGAWIAPHECGIRVLCSLRAKPFPLVEIPGVDDRRHRRRFDTVFMRCIVNVGISVDPDACVEIPERFEIALTQPLAAGRGRIVDHVPQTQDDPRLTRLAK